MDHTENDGSNKSSITDCVFVAAETCLPSRCLATKERVHVQTHRESRLKTEEMLEAFFFFTVRPEVSRQLKGAETRSLEDLITEKLPSRLRGASLTVIVRLSGIMSHICSYGNGRLIRLQYSDFQELGGYTQTAR
jgi:hypothetical protein